MWKLNLKSLVNSSDLGVDCGGIAQQQYFKNLGSHGIIEIWNLREDERDFANLPDSGRTRWREGNVLIMLMAVVVK